MNSRMACCARASCSSAYCLAQDALGEFRRISAPAFRSPRSDRNCSSGDIARNLVTSSIITSVWLGNLMGSSMVVSEIGAEAGSLSPTQLNSDCHDDERDGSLSYLSN